ncbi:MAG: DNA-directed RNA polymerase [Candidatus Micrarchaeota archaeon]
MYALFKVRDMIRVPPKEFTHDLKASVLKIAQQDYEGIVDDELGIVVAVTDVDSVGEGKVVPGDGAAYYETVFDALVFKPEIQEVVHGNVSEVTEFGAFVKIGPMEGLVHVSQIMDDYINYDAKSASFVGRESSKKLIVEDNILARIVTCSLKNSVQNSKIGLTMRQIGLGKEDWLKIDQKNREKKEKMKKEIAARPAGKASAKKQES